jgi:secreted PhoX family phosphatase
MTRTTRTAPRSNARRSDASSTKAPNVWLNEDGRVVVYTGDDQVFEYLYKFVSTGRYDPNDREANRELLDHGTLFVARFADDGSMRWLPLVWGTGPLTPANDFHSQADVLIETRRAADLLGATPLDRPEDVEPNPVNGLVYVMLTNNKERTPEQTDAANPRPQNRHGHVIELVPPGEGKQRNHAALAFQWRILLRGGNPAVQQDQASYHPATDEDGWLSCPDNCAFDPMGRLWISTDQGSAQVSQGIPDGIRACTVEGPERARTLLFYACPRGAEMCGPCFTPDGKTLFVAVQHPGEDKGSSFDAPSTRWPDFDDQTPPRPSVVAITRNDGGLIGGA